MVKKILIIGLGGVGQRHLRNINAKFGNEVSILAYRVRNWNQTITDELTIDTDTDFIEKYRVKVFDSLDEALAEKPEVAFICNPTSLHMSTCLAVAEAGCDFFVEKPLSDSMEGVDELLEICEEKKLVAMVGYQLRFHPCYKLFKELIEQKAVGNILSVHSEVGEFLPGWRERLNEDYRQLFASRRDLGGGVVLTQSHEIDYLCDLFGMPHYISALGGHLSELEIDVEDTADVLFEMKREGKSFPVSLHMDYLQVPASRFCKVVGDKGTITMDLIASRVIVQDGAKYGFGGFKRNQLFIDEIDHFFECVDKREEPDISLVDGVISLKVALAIKESMQDLEPVCGTRRKGEQW